MSDKICNEQLMPEVMVLDGNALREYILERTNRIVKYTSGISWDDPEEWQIDAAELAHAVARMIQQGQL